MPFIDYGTNDLRTSGIGYFSGIVLTGGVGFITDAMVAAGTGIQASKLDHKYVATLSQPNTTATTFRQAIHAAHKAGTILQFRAATTVACIGAATISVRIKKNGTNVDTAALVLDSSNTAMIFENAAGFTSTAVAANDYFEVDVTSTAGGGTLGTGLTMQLILEEDY